MVWREDIGFSVFSFVSFPFGRPFVAGGDSHCLRKFPLPIKKPEKEIQRD
jgi:hypothetical protein